jgi:hypothetical protein
MRPYVPPKGPTPWWVIGCAVPGAAIALAVVALLVTWWLVQPGALLHPR